MHSLFKKRKCTFDAYLDIETTGLSQYNCYITVIGIYKCNHNIKEDTLIQLYGSSVTSRNLLEALKDVTKIYTYNGRRFDLPFIETQLGLNLEQLFEHNDLMFKCWEKNLKGGLKSVERQLGIDRLTDGIGGYEAVILWRRYIEDADEDALELLLKYNRDDVINLKTLREKLEM